MSDAKRTKNYIVHKLRKSYREGKLDTSQVARLKAIGFDFEGAVFNASKDSLAVQYPAIAEEWDKERNGKQTPWKVRPLATEKAWWRCPHCDRPYRLAIRSKVISNSGCPYCGYGGKRAQVSLPVIRLDTLIGLCCKNPYLTFDGKHWCYPDDLESRIDNAEEYTVPGKTAVRCLETGKMYESIADASRDTGINYNSIGSVARGNRHKAGGYTWEYVNPAPDKRDNRGCNQPTAKKVRCAETGNQFVSLSDAARAVGLRNGNSIRRAIDRGGTAGGYHWEYLDEKKEVSTDDHHQADGRAE